MKEIQTTQQEAMCQVHELKEDYQLRETHKPMVAYDNFNHATASRETGKPERGYGSVLPRYQLQYGKRHLDTTHRVDYQYPFDWTPKAEEVVTNLTIITGYSAQIMLLLMQNVFLIFRWPRMKVQRLNIDMDCQSLPIRLIIGGKA